MCLVAGPLNESEAGVDIVLIEISLRFFFFFFWGGGGILMRKAVGFAQNKVHPSLALI